VTVMHAALKPCVRVAGAASARTPVVQRACHARQWQHRRRIPGVGLAASRAGPSARAPACGADPWRNGATSACPGSRPDLAQVGDVEAFRRRFLSTVFGRPVIGLSILRAHRSLPRLSQF
jgi:hypothetical protein